MAEGFELQASARERVGKGAARELRRNGMIPAVIYGGKQPPMPIAIPYKETFLRLHAGGFLTNIWTIDVGGKKVRALARDYQLEPVRDFLSHVDFLRVTADTRATVEVPVSFVNEDESEVLREGNVLEVVSHTIPLECPAAEIPDVIEYDVSGIAEGATIMITDLPLPEGITIPAGSEEVVVATVKAPTLAPADEEEEPTEAEALDGTPEEEGGAGEEGEGESDENA